MIYFLFYLTIGVILATPGVVVLASDGDDSIFRTLLTGLLMAVLWPMLVVAVVFGRKNV